MFVSRAVLETLTQARPDSSHLAPQPDGQTDEDSCVIKNITEDSKDIVPPEVRKTRASVCVRACICVSMQEHNP